MRHSREAVQTNMQHQTINKILEENEDEADVQYIWLADTYNTLPDSNPPYNVHGTQTPVSDSWRSPSIGKCPQQVAKFVRDAPSPPKPIDKEYCAVLRKEDHGRDEIMISEIPPEGDKSEPQTIVNSDLQACNDFQSLAVDTPFFSQ